MPESRLPEERCSITFADCLIIAANMPEFVQQWERLTGLRLLPASPLDRLIDEATGYDLAVMAEFADFVYRCVFCTMDAL